jgi:hypothetical protein
VVGDIEQARGVLSLPEWRAIQYNSLAVRQSIGFVVG